jgi:hypothetical protein
MAIERRRMAGGYLPLRDAIDRLSEGSFIFPQMMIPVAQRGTSQEQNPDGEVQQESVPAGSGRASYRYFVGHGWQRGLCSEADHFQPGNGQYRASHRPACRPFRPFLQIQQTTVIGSLLT